MKKKTKRIVSLCVSATLLGSSFSAMAAPAPVDSSVYESLQAAAQAKTSCVMMKLGETQARVDGKMVSTGVYENGHKPSLALVNNAASLPLRYVCSALGHTTSYNSLTNNSRIIDSNTNYIYELVSGSNQILKYDANENLLETITASAKTVLISNTTYIPIRTLLKEMGYNITWDYRGYAIISTTELSSSEVLELIEKWGTDDVITDDKEEEPETPAVTEPPYPFWIRTKSYPTANTYVYFKGQIFYNKWYADMGVEPTDPDPANAWTLVGDAEWVVPESDSNYEEVPEDIDKILTTAEIQKLYGGINESYSPEAAANRIDELMPKSYYEELFPYRFGSELWKELPDTKQYYPNADELPDYYSYENLKEAVKTLSNTIVKVQWYEGAEWCYRLIRLDKTTKQQKLIYSDPSFGEEWLESGKTLKTSICDYGSFLAVGDLNTRKRELAGFLANISHETGGGKIGTVDESVTGLYFNEEVGFIGSSAIGYVQSTGTSYLPVAGKSYHGRGPIQLSYNYNYGLCSDVLFGDSSVLLNDPDLLEENGVLGIMTGIWFWLTPQPPKPSCHEVITGIWEPDPGTPNEEFNKNFGLTIVIINNESGQSEGGTGAVSRRARYYRLFAGKMNADITGEHCDTMGMTTFVS